MTVRVEDTTIKVKVKKHPNDGKYPGRACRDMMFALLDFVTKLTPKQKIAFENGSLKMDPAATLTDIQTFLPKDKIGLAVQYENGWIPTVMEIEKIDLKNKEISGMDVFEKEELAVTFSELSVSRALGYCEILYRDNKPFGQPEEQELKVRIHYEAKEENDPSGEVKDTDKTAELLSKLPKNNSEYVEPTDIL